MASRQKSRKTYRSMQGKVVDLDMLIKRNELTPAVGNARVNARGDELGPGGKIIRKREEVVKEYYSSGSEPVQHESAARVEGLSQAEAEEMMEFNEEVIPEKPKATVQPKQTTQSKSQSAKDNWVEDDDGNFINKGD